MIVIGASTEHTRTHAERERDEHDSYGDGNITRKNNVHVDNTPGQMDAQNAITTEPAAMSPMFTYKPTGT